MCFQFLGYIPRSQVVESCGNTVFNALKECQVVFQGDHTILNSTQLWEQRLHLFLFLHQYVLFYFIVVFYYIHPGGCEVVSHCGLDLCFPDG